jgi:hypothetical protein
MKFLRSVIFLAPVTVQSEIRLGPSACRHLGISQAQIMSPVSHDRPWKVVVTRVLPQRVTPTQGLDLSTM